MRIAAPPTSTTTVGSSEMRVRGQNLAPQERRAKAASRPTAVAGMARRVLLLPIAVALGELNSSALIRGHALTVLLEPQEPLLIKATIMPNAAQRPRAAAARAVHVVARGPRRVRRRAPHGRRGSRRAAPHRLAPHRRYTVEVDALVDPDGDSAAATPTAPRPRTRRRRRRPRSSGPCGRATRPPRAGGAAAAPRGRAGALRASPPGRADVRAHRVRHRAARRHARADARGRARRLARRDRPRAASSWEAPSCDGGGKPHDQHPERHAVVCFGPASPDEGGAPRAPRCARSRRAARSCATSRRRRATAAGSAR